MGVLGSVSEQGNGLVYCVQISPRLRPVPDRPSQPCPVPPGAEGKAPSSGRQGQHPLDPEGVSSTWRHGKWLLGGVVLTQGSLPSAVREKNSAEKRCAKMGSVNKACRVPGDGVRLLVGTCLLPLLPHALSRCVYCLWLCAFPYQGSPSIGSLALDPGLLKLSGTLLPPPRAAAHLGKCTARWEVGFGMLGHVGDLGVSPALWAASSSTLGI